MMSWPDVKLIPQTNKQTMSRTLESNTILFINLHGLKPHCASGEMGGGRKWAFKRGMLNIVT